jgi:hypothetical protein
MRSSRLILIVMGVCGLNLCLGTLARAEEMDNPQFLAWTKFDVGSSETLEATVAGPNGREMKVQSTNKLLDKAADHVTIEIVASMNVMGQTRTMPPQKQTVRSRIEKKDYKQIGTEEVSAAGKTIMCKVYEGKGMAPAPQGPPRQGAAQQGGGTAKVWVSDEVPGGLVKVEAQSEKGKVQMILKSYEAR